MRKYVLTRILKSIISIMIVVSIVISMIYVMIPKTKIFDDDTSYRKLTGDNKTTYVNSRYEELGYSDFLRLSEMCKEASDDYDACMIKDSAEYERVLEHYRDRGYDVEFLRNGNPYAVHFYNIPELVLHFWANLIEIDTPNYVQKKYDVTLDNKGYTIGKDVNNRIALMCSGCEYKYQIYFNGSFPFIHQNMIRLHFGISYPTKAGMQTIAVISEGQGEQVPIEQAFPTGKVMDSAINQYSCKFKSSLDHLDEQKFTDNYADCGSYYKSPSMINTSYIFGIISLIMAYLIGIPAGIAMSRNKGKIGDKIGVAYINLIIAMPSLALIFFIREIGAKFGLPDKFPLLGFGDVRSYITPLVILTILSTPGLMTWTRRYMLDQSNADYVKFAKSKGLSQREIFRNHILKNAIIPIVNGIPGSVILCIGGALITESAFAIPGMGKMLPDAIRKMNNNMVITLTFIFASLAIISVFLGDLLMTVVDPRIQLASKGED